MSVLTPEPDWGADPYLQRTTLMEVLAARTAPIARMLFEDMTDRYGVGVYYKDGRITAVNEAKPITFGEILDKLVWEFKQ